ncbi:unnamed protein product [Ilex paraguariensis]|uniref:Uncharacterized protein n=1 Tax=Ilex paraguariensis TaxID=185542 RepID=A0ABC8TUV8_9AQUA
MISLHISILQFPIFIVECSTQLCIFGSQSLKPCAGLNDVVDWSTVHYVVTKYRFEFNLYMRNSFIFLFLLFVFHIYLSQNVRRSRNTIALGNHLEKFLEGYSCYGDVYPWTKEHLLHQNQ